MHEFLYLQHDFYHCLDAGKIQRKRLSDLFKFQGTCSDLYCKKILKLTTILLSWNFSRNLLTVSDRLFFTSGPDSGVCHRSTHSSNRIRGGFRDATLMWRGEYVGYEPYIIYDHRRRPVGFRLSAGIHRRPKVSRRGRYGFYRRPRGLGEGESRPTFCRFRFTFNVCGFNLQTIFSSLADEEFLLAYNAMQNTML